MGGKSGKGREVRKQLIKHRVTAKSIFYVSVYFILKETDKGYTVNEMIHNMEEVNIRDRNGIVNKCRHQRGI